MDQILTSKQVADYLRLHQITVCKYASEGKIPAVRIGKVWRFNRDAVVAWLEQTKHAKVGAGPKPHTMPVPWGKPRMSSAI